MSEGPATKITTFHVKRDLAATPADCPSCGLRLSAVSTPDADAPRPRPGDFTVCAGCFTVLAFGEDLKPRLLTPAEKAEARTVPELMAALSRAAQLAMTELSPSARGRRS